MTNKTISMASKKTVALLVAAASLGTGVIAGSAAYAATNNGAAATKNEDKLVDGVAPLAITLRQKMAASLLPLERWTSMI